MSNNAGVSRSRRDVARWLSIASLPATVNSQADGSFGR